MESGEDASFFNEIGDAMGDDAGFAAACSSEEEHGAVDGENSLALLGGSCWRGDRAQTLFYLVAGWGGFAAVVLRVL